MPRLNRDGDVLAGIAGVQASINGTAIPLRGGAAWETDWMAVGQTEVAPDDWRLAEVIPDTGEVRFVAAHPFGAHAVVAGGGRWYTYFNDALRSNGPLSGANCYPLAADWDGSVAILTDYQAGTGVTCYSANGVVQGRLDVTLTRTSGCFLRDGWFTYHANGLWRAYHVGARMATTIVPREGVSWMVPVVRGTELWLLERHDEIGLTLRYPLSRLVSVVVAGPSQQLFDPDIVRVGTGFVVAWSETIGEEAGRVRWVTVPDGQELPVVDTTPPPAPPPVPAVRPPAVGAAFVRGMCAGFGAPVREFLDELTAHGVMAIRQECEATPGPNVSPGHARPGPSRFLPVLHDEAYRIPTLWLCASTDYVPDRAEAELLNEWDYAGWLPDQYARYWRQESAKSQGRLRRLWMGAVGNTSRRQLGLVARVLAVEPSIQYVCLHRYVDGPCRPHKDYASLAEERAEILRVLGGRDFLVTECGWKPADVGGMAKARDAMIQEAAWWMGMPGCRGVFQYQLHGEFGVRDEATGQWNAMADWLTADLASVVVADPGHPRRSSWIRWCG